jgi:hypothetical protein
MTDSDYGLPAAAPESEWSPYQRAYMRAHRISNIRLSQKSRLVDWARCQRRTQEWISLSEIADWCARVPGSVARNQDLMAQAWHDLARSIVAGEFIRASKSGRRRLCIAYVPPSPWGFSSPEPVRFRLRASDLGNGALAYCWVPQELAARWLLVRNLDLLPGMAACLMQDVAAEAVVASPPDTAPLAPFDEKKAAPILAGLKIAKRFPDRPKPSEAQAALEAHFDHVPRDPVIRIIRKLWGQGKRGPRNPRNSTPETRAKATSKVESPRNSPRN